MRDLPELREALGSRLDDARRRLAERPRAAATVLVLPRHGHGTVRATLDSVRAHTDPAVPVVAIDIASPPGVRAHLEKRAADDAGFVHLRIDELTSRQLARKLALELVATEHVVFLDNNMLVAPGWLDALLRASAETGAGLISPLIVHRGGEIHFSAGIVKQRFGRGAVRLHQQPGGPVGADWRSCRLERVDIDFAESHACLARTEAVRLPGVLVDAMHNAQTLCYAALALKRRHGRRCVLEPGAVAAIAPIGFGYDLDWMLRGYLDRALLEGSYRTLHALIGGRSKLDLSGALWWHRMHLKYLLHTMTFDDRLTRGEPLATDELPERVQGYDRALPPGVDARIRDVVLPQVRSSRPELEPLLRRWID